MMKYGRCYGTVLALIVSVAFVTLAWAGDQVQVAYILDSSTSSTVGIRSVNIETF